MNGKMLFVLACIAASMCVGCSATTDPLEVTAESVTINRSAAADCAPIPAQTVAGPSKVKIIPAPVEPVSNEQLQKDMQKLHADLNAAQRRIDAAIVRAEATAAPKAKE